MQNPTSKLLANEIDLKSLTFHCIDEMLNASLDTIKSGEIEGASINGDINTIIVTNFGIVKGDLVKEQTSTNDESLGFSEAVILKSIEIRNDEISKLENENAQLKLINDTRAIVLKNVTITPYANSNTPFKLENLILFSDQIVGISIGEIA